MSETVIFESESPAGLETLKVLRVEWRSPVDSTARWNRALTMTDSPRNRERAVLTAESWHRQGYHTRVVLVDES